MTRNNHTLILVSLDWRRDKDPKQTLAHSSLAVALGQVKGVNLVELVYDITSVPTAGRMCSDIGGAVGRASSPNTAVAFGVYVWNEPLVLETAGLLRAAGYAGKLILGGPMISYTHRDLERLYPDADVFIRGYAEEALATLVSSGFDKLPIGVHVAGDRDSCLHAVPDFKTLPSPFLVRPSQLVGTTGFARWETKRGCPYRCAYCQHCESGDRLKWREFCIHRLRAEAELIVRLGVKHLRVIDPVFNLQGTHYLAVLRHLRTLGFGGTITLECRFERVTDEFLRLCGELSVNLEFGLQTINRPEELAIDRRNDLGKVESVVEQLHLRRIPFLVTLIYGLPNQTLDSFRATVDYCSGRLRVPKVVAHPLALLRGTALQRDRAKWDLQTNGDVVPLVVASSTFDEHDWLEMGKTARSLRVS